MSLESFLWQLGINMQDILVLKTNVSVQTYELYLYILHINKNNCFSFTVIKVTYVGCTE